MALNYIWLGLFIIGFITALFRTFYFHDLTVFPALAQGIFDMCKTSVDIAIYLVGIMTFWLGIMKVGERAGAIQVIAKWVSPVLHRLFPSIPKNHSAFGSMMMNISANMLGLDNAATPLGLKAMKELQDINPEPEKASNAQIMFLVLNASGLTLIPISILAMRASQHAANPADVFLPILLATTFSTIGGIIYVSIAQKINLFAKELLIPFIAILLGILGLFKLTQSMSSDTMGVYTSLIGNFMILFFVIAFLGFSLWKKNNTYSDFIDGAKEGFQSSISILPYLLAMLVAVGVFRASGSLDFIMKGFEKVFLFFNWRTDILPAFPTAMMKPLSGGGARAMMIDVMENKGADSIAGRFQGSSETTMYVLAVYYGSVQIKKTRYTLWAGLFADLCGFLAAIFLCLYFFR